MVRIYLKEGQMISVAAAVKAEIKSERLPHVSVGTHILVCTDQAGNIVGYLNWPDVIGYSLDESASQDE